MNEFTYECMVSQADHVVRHLFEELHSRTSLLTGKLRENIKLRMRSLDWPEDPMTLIIKEQMNEIVCRTLSR